MPHTSTDIAGRRKTALLIGNTHFYSLFKVIAGGLEQAGYDVTVANDEYPNNVWGKIFGKLGLFSLLTKTTYHALVREFLEGKRYDVALIFKGRGISPALLERMQLSVPVVVGYNFDSFSFNPAPLAWYKYVTRYCTFDYADAARHNLPVVDLFSSLPLDTERKPTRYQISAIMRNHSKRLRYLDKVLKTIRVENAFIYIFELNRITFLLNFIQNPLLYFKYRQHIHFKSLSYGDYVEVLTASDFTVDYAHPDQTGITIRCFEALHAGTKIISNNSQAISNPLFDRDSVIVFRGAADVENLRDRYVELRDKEVPRKVRTIADLIRELLDVPASRSQAASRDDVERTL